MLLTAAGMLAPALAEPPAVGAPPANVATEAERTITVGGHFSVVAPTGWASTIESPSALSPDEKQAWGLILHGPSPGEVVSRISVHYFANDGLPYRSINHYLNVFAKPALGVALAGSEYGPVGDATVAGRAAKVFERTRNEFVPARNLIDFDDKGERREPRVYDRREMMARPVAVRERLVVIPAESGFFALRYSARQVDFNAFVPEFEKVLARFVPRH